MAKKAARMAHNESAVTAMTLKRFVSNFDYEKWACERIHVPNASPALARTHLLQQMHDAEVAERRDAEEQHAQHDKQVANDGCRPSRQQLLNGDANRGHAQ